MRLLLLAFFIFSSAKALAVTPEEVLNWSGSDFKLSEIFKSLNLNFDTRYQIGDEWGKKPVTDQDMRSDVHFARMATATARVRGGGTGFYLGEFNGRFVVATNHHVCPSAMQCSGQDAIDFPILGFKSKIIEFYGSWPEIDLSLFAIEVNDANMVNELNSISSPFAFHNDLQHAAPLVTIGFGIANNYARQLVANRDSDCVVFSADAEYRLMADPDDLNPGEYKAWSFANGCDVSHGDSGSAMMDRASGSVVGIIWTGRIPKSRKVQSSAYLAELLKTPNEDIWKELSYGVPAVHMFQYLNAQVANGGIEKAHMPTIQALLSQ
ncbi:MAG: trypsin-like peptidase domain-containing protein [Bdellovibrionales bacterium]|nr:trypsin-like peptidase domain-containing protein [Bdellovibrionales bacterium]